MLVVWFYLYSFLGHRVVRSKDIAISLPRGETSQKTLSLGSLGFNYLFIVFIIQYSIINTMLIKEKEITINEVFRALNSKISKVEFVIIRQASGNEIYHIKKQNKKAKTPFKINILLSNFQSSNAFFCASGGFDSFRKSLTLLPICENSIV